MYKQDLALKKTDNGWYAIVLYTLNEEIITLLYKNISFFLFTKVGNGCVREPGNWCDTQCLQVEMVSSERLTSSFFFQGSLIQDRITTRGPSLQKRKKLAWLLPDFPWLCWLTDCSLLTADWSLVVKNFRRYIFLDAYAFLLRNSRGMSSVFCLPYNTAAYPILKSTTTHPVKGYNAIFFIIILFKMFTCEQPKDIVLPLAKSSSCYLIHQEPQWQLKYWQLLFPKSL